MAMGLAILQTYSLPQVGGMAPNAVAYAGSVPVRVVIKNIGAGTVNLGFNSQDVQGPDGLSGAIFQLAPGDDLVLVMANGQRLYANSSAPAGRVCVAVSDALPLV